MKNIAILILAVCVSQFSFAQVGSSGPEKQFRFGLKGAANIGWITPGSKNIESNGAKFGFAYGLMGDYYFQPNYALSFEVLLSDINGGLTLNEPQTFNADSTGGPINGLNYNYNLQYVELPISFKFRTKEIGNITYWANFGFSPGFVTKAQLSIDGNLPTSVINNDPNDFLVNDGEGDPFTTDNFDDQVFLFRFPLIVGGGIEYALAGNTSLYTGVRFTNSFTDILVKDKNVNAKNNYFSLNLGVFF